MGIDNKKRRAAKARSRRSRHSSHRHHQAAGGPTAGRRDPFVLTPADLFDAALHAHRAGDADTVSALVDRLAQSPARQVVTVVARALNDVTAAAWRSGWQPADVDRIARRELGRADVKVVRAAIAAEAASYEALGATAAPGWIAQLRTIGASRWWPPDTSYLESLEVPWPEVLASSVRSVALLVALPELPKLVPPPHAWRVGMTVIDQSLPPAVLDRVRALLAKAESTTFEAEAESFTAKAQELMTRYRIDRAVVQSSATGGPEPMGRRLGIDDPYADAKAILLDAVARPNGCRSVWSKGLGFATVFGFGDELDVVDELFTSLLVQANAALSREGSKRDSIGRSRTTRFRRSFLVAFASRIGRRLQDAADATIGTASTETGMALVPVLAAREDATDAATRAAFPHLSKISSSATDREGWYAGTLFADVADLGTGTGATDELSA